MVPNHDVRLPGQESESPARSPRQPLRVGLNLVYLVRRAGGAGTYARELIPELLRAEPDLAITAFASRELDPADRDATWAAEVEWVELPLTFTHGPPWNLVRAARAQWLTIPWQARRRRLDVVHGVANMGPLVAPRAATVLTLHDLIWMRHPDTMTQREVLGTKLSAIPSARMADRVIAVSEYARADMVSTLGLDPGRIDVIPHGVRTADIEPVSEQALRRKLGLGTERVVLCVSQKRTHKNLANLIRAVEGLDATLVLPGASTPYELALRQLAANVGVADRVVFPEWLEPEELEGLYRLAACFALPSLEEGFGLPVLEAMARGVPVCCADAAALPEVAGDAALLFDPRDVESIRRALGRLLGEPGLAADLARRGRERVRVSTWRRTAEATLATYRRAIDSRRFLSLDRGGHPR